MRKCRICECTDTDAYVTGCEWVQLDLCSTCAEVIGLLVEYWFSAGPSTRDHLSHDGLFARATQEAQKLLAETTPAEEPNRIIVP